MKHLKLCHSPGSLYKAKFLPIPKTLAASGSVLLPHVHLTSMEMIIYITSVFRILFGFKKYSKMAYESKMTESFQGLVFSLCSAS